MNYISEVQAGGGVPLYQLKITLKWSKPPIWRRVVVRADMSLDRLHDVIQIAMGWTNSHLHQFMAGSGFSRTYYGKPDPEYADMGTEMLNERRYTVADLAPAPKRKFIYEYDFGDGWQHEIVAEKVLPPDPGVQASDLSRGRERLSAGGLRRHGRLLQSARHHDRPKTSRTRGDEGVD